MNGDRPMCGKWLEGGTGGYELTPAVVCMRPEGHDVTGATYSDRTCSNMPLATAEPLPTEDQ